MFISTGRVNTYSERKVLALVAGVPRPREPEHRVCVVLVGAQQPHVLGRINPRGPVALSMAVLWEDLALSTSRQRLSGLHGLLESVQQDSLSPRQCAWWQAHRNSDSRAGTPPRQRPPSPARCPRPSCRHSGRSPDPRSPWRPPVGDNKTALREVRETGPEIRRPGQIVSGNYTFETLLYDC